MWKNLIRWKDILISNLFRQRPFIILKIIVFVPQKFHVNPFEFSYTSGADISRNRIEEDILTAERIWKINIHHTITKIPNPVNGEINARYISCKKDLGPQKEGLIKEYAQSDIITVFYIPGEDTDFGGCSSPRINDSNGKLKGSIFLSDKGMSIRDILAHEIGHTLFARIENSNVTSINPGSEHLSRPENAHSIYEDNLMYADGNGEKLTSIQRQKALDSPFIRSWWIDFVRRLLQIRYPIPRPPGRPKV
ncbi:hypothetical protein COM87_02685 [Bacillus thuringiensis]|uniref:hypothetical protein n=1 Tax=Bacillus cereus group TaxID=86661 RepID=UPI000BEC30DA|nr:hypothetical protein [Bacillus thuringiensis]PDY61949.1 hypothetical protein COM87_02685 [Bacillus thuringiensis]